MFASKLLGYFLVVLALINMPLVSRDIILEFKGAYFRTTGSRFKKIYGHGGALYGPELTFQLCDNSCWYGFASVDFFHKKGHSIGLSTPTKVSLLPVGLGLKYFMPLGYECVDFYIGLGFQPVHVRTRALSAFVPQQNKWALGGIAKVGAYIDLSCNFVLDLFIDYSFAEVSSHVTQASAGPLVPLRSSVGGAIFGVGLGYRF